MALEVSITLRVTLVLCSILSSASHDLKITELSKFLEDELDSLITEVTGKEMLQQVYSQQVFHLEPVHGEDILEEAIEKLEPMFQRRVRAVEEIARKAEELALAHEYEEQPQSSQVRFLNGKDWEDPHFLVNNSFTVTQQQSGHSIMVNVNTSAVHLPLQTYEGWMWHRFKPVWYEDFDTINSLIWTSHLDPVFAENLKRDPTLHWQYFASKEGLLRYFPAHRWRIHTNQQDTYDARQRPWFTHTIASPKDLLILIDMSGSIHGPTFEMVKITVKRLLGTLSQHDYFNVLQFNETVSWLLPCCDMLIPATTRNKRLIYQALDHVEPLGKASYANVLNFTYHLILELENSRNNESGSRGSNCHLAVVLISDGGTEFPAEQMEMIMNNSITRQTRLFTLAVGPHPIPTLNLRNISCSTNAFHGAILTYGAIRSKVQGYLQVLSRPLALSLNESLLQWSLPYEDAAGSGQVLSVTKPVFQKGENLSQTLLGVAGVDIPLISFDRALPDSILGYGGYKMVVAPTGNAVLHPKIAEHSSFIEDQLMVDFEDLEPIGNWTDELRVQLLEGKIGSIEYTPTIMTPDSAYVVRPLRSWHFRPITKTAYTLAVSTTDGVNIIVPNLELQGDIKWNYNMLTKAAPRKYCYNVFSADFSTNFNEMPSYFRQLSEEFEKRAGDCDFTALSHLLWDFEITANVSQFWPQVPDVHSRYVITTGGVTRMELGTPEFLQKELTDPHNSSTFLRLAHSSNASILIQPPSAHTKDYMIAAKIDLKDQLMALTGALVSAEKILSLWEKVVESYNAVDHSSLYWLDEGGYILSSNTDIKAGTFVGNADPQLADQLLSGPNPVFNKETIKVPTTSCPVFIKATPTSSSPVFYARWAGNVIQTLFGLAQVVATLATIMISSVSGTFQAEMELEKLRPAKVDSHICSKEYVLFYLKATADSVLELPCKSLCSGNNESYRTITVHPMKKSKTVMISATPSCKCEDLVMKHGLVNVENEMERCQFNNRFRKSTEVCFASDSRENSLECSAPSVRLIDFLPLLFISTIIWVMC